MSTSIPRVNLAVFIVEVKPLLGKKSQNFPPSTSISSHISLLYWSLSLQLPLFSPFFLLLPLFSLLGSVAFLVFFRLLSLSFLNLAQVRK